MRLSEGLLACAMITLAACTDLGPVPRPPRLQITFVNGSLPTTAVRPLEEVGAPISIEVRDERGELARSAFVILRGTTGTITVPAIAGLANRWVDPVFAYLKTDSQGIFTFRWLPSSAAQQHLSVAVYDYAHADSVTRADSISIAISAIGSTQLFTGEVVVPSGALVTCALVGGRVGCTGRRRVGDSALGFDAIDTTQFESAVGTVHWLELPAPATDLVSMRWGACALLSGGSVACWDQLGPRGRIPVIAGAPPIRKLGRSLSLTVAGDVGRISSASNFASVDVRWTPVTSDSAIARLAPDMDEGLACGFTSSNGVRCTSGRTGPASAELLPLASAIGAPWLRARSIVWDWRKFSSDSSIYLVGLDSVRTEFVVTPGIRFGVALSAVPPHAPTSLNTEFVRADDGSVNCAGFNVGPCAVTASRWRSINQYGYARLLVPLVQQVSGPRRICAVGDFVVCEVIFGKYFTSVHAIDTVRTR
jgi:hypothetical protein